VVRRVLSRAREERLKEAYCRHGAKIVFTARHVIGLRAAAFLTAGIVRLPFSRFVSVDAMASLLGVPLGFGAAFLFTDQLERVVSDVHRVERWLALVALAAAAVWIAWAALRKARRQVEPEEPATVPRRML
jgi:membrane protein DedA with SNARE-associated domain